MIFNVGDYVTWNSRRGTIIEPCHIYHLDTVLNTHLHSLGWIIECQSLYGKCVVPGSKLTLVSNLEALAEAAE
jgi:hypothetical protein